MSELTGDLFRFGRQQQVAVVHSHGNLVTDRQTYRVFGEFITTSRRPATTSTISAAETVTIMTTISAPSWGPPPGGDGQFGTKLI